MSRYQDRDLPVAGKPHLFMDGGRWVMCVDVFGRTSHVREALKFCESDGEERVLKSWPSLVRPTLYTAY